MSGDPEDDDLDGFEKFDASAWFAAIRAADTWHDANAGGPKKSGNLERLVSLLRGKLIDARTGVTMTREECELLIDLLSRHRLKHKPGKQRTPAYKRTQSEIKLEIAAELVRHYQRQNRTLAEAVELAAQEVANVSQDALTLHMRGQLGSSRRRR